MLKELVIKESIKLIFATATNKIKNSNFRLKASKAEIEASINQHLRTVKNWSGEITFKDIKTSKQVSEIFIPLDLYVYPQRIKIDLDETIKITPLLEIFKKEKNHLAILGQPGAGKTTSMKYICQAIFFDEEFFPTLFNYPILIKLREFNKPIKGKNKAGIIFEYLFNLFGLRLDNINPSEEITEDQIIRTKEFLVLEILEQLKVLLIIDGFDEMVFKNHREIVKKEVGKIANFLEQSKFVITSRIADFNYIHENLSIYEICPLNRNQINEFAFKWLGKAASLKFLSEVETSPYQDTAIRPLTIAHLCAIYERIGKIPDKPKTVYKKIVNLLLEEWDEQRSVRRESKYALFEIDRKFEFLSNLAFQLTTKNGQAIFSKNDLLNIYDEIYIDFDLNKREALGVVNDIESHTGLFVQAGYEYYEFSHKSIQEYLTAEYIVKLPKIPNQRRLIERIPNELAITITISSNPSIYFVELVDGIFNKMELSNDFIQKFINRLLLEKPDFYKNFQVGLAALILYSKLLHLNKEPRNQLALFRADYLLSEFELFINLIFKRNSRDIIKGIYHLNHSAETMDNTIVSVLKKRKVFPSKLSGKLSLENFHKSPDLIYCRDSFINFNT